MDISIQHGPGNAAARVDLSPGDSIVAEGGAMISMSAGVSITTEARKRGQGGLFGAIKRLASGESFFINTFTAGQSGGSVDLAATLAGDMQAIEMDLSTNLIVQSGSYVCSEPGLKIDLGWTGFKSLFAKEGLFWLNISGSGKLVINSFGAIFPIDIDGEYVVDTGHIVAFDETLDYSLSKAGKSWVSSFLGGEGFVCRFKGTGSVWCQSHNSPGFGKRIGPMLKPR
ncbi:MAG: TIGR00266 family protein [Opitutales bacterium]|nr:TIGR00266 family protein [Opitutales bacterium]NRA28486.1 TIGR00266 family protein [Opitutales bacterium]